MEKRAIARVEMKGGVSIVDSCKQLAEQLVIATTSLSCFIAQ